MTKKRWQLRDDPGFPPPERKQILNDLLSNYKLVGLSYKELNSLLGAPDITDSSGANVSYEIDIHYDMIDPDYIKSL